MIKAIVSDFSRVLLFPLDPAYTESLNDLHKKLSREPHYDPFKHFRLNTELLDYFRSLKGSVDLAVFTSDVIQDAPEFRSRLLQIFRVMYSASKMGTSKKNPAAYAMIARELGLAPADILFVDDGELPLAAAGEAGFVTIRYQDNAQVVEGIQKLLTASR